MCHVVVFMMKLFVEIVFGGIQTLESESGHSRLSHKDRLPGLSQAEELQEILELALRLEIKHKSLQSLLGSRQAGVL